MAEDRWKKIWEDLKPQIGSFAKKAGDAITDLAKTLGKESVKLAKIAGLKAEILSLEGDKREYLRRLGEEIYKGYKEGRDLTKEEIQKFIEEIEKIEKSIDEKQEEIKKIAEEEKLEPEDVEKIPPSQDE
ncbi:MAG: DUF47 domain-containing protein [Dictyoglomus sp. NZ13-RE01]|nr:MAG: DUF47 domain-containing protein [Dictyoglomus sp. NZ13-RE01]